MTLLKQPIGQHQTVHDAITCSFNSSYCVIEEDSAQIPSRDIVVCGGMIHSIPQGNKDSDRTSQGRRGRKQPILRRPGHLGREVTSDTTHDWHEILHRELCSRGEPKCEHFFGARGTELSQCQGYRTFVVPGAQNLHSARRHRTLKVPGAQTDCNSMATVLDHSGQINLLFLLP